MGEYIVTGGTGFLGRNLIRRLISEKNKVYAIVRPESKNIALLPESDNVIPVFSSLEDLSRVINELPVDCETFFHFAWGGVNRNEIDDDLVQQKNIDDSMVALDTAMNIGCKKFVFAGSRSEYGRQDSFYSEDLECNPIVAYGRAKLSFGRKAFEKTRGSNIKYLHPRIFSVYGPDDHPWSLIYSSVSKMLRNEDIDLSECKHYWNFMNIYDAIDLIYTISISSELIPEEDNCIFNVATDDIRPLRDYVEEMKRVLGSDSRLNFGAYKQSAESAVSLLPDMKKVNDIFNWSSNVSFADGIKEIAKNMENKDA